MSKKILNIIKKELNIILIIILYANILINILKQLNTKQKKKIKS
jgi:hypothetical protein